MLVCERCGEENPDYARFCMACTSPLGEPSADATRRTVSIVFSDLAGSTALGESLDPEALREVLGSYFDAMRSVVERFGGTVEKFIGDAIMAVFGIPRVHEDDAIRAVLAACAMRERLTELNAELEAAWDVRLTNRTGVHTGEVVTGDAATGLRLVTGDAVNTAARLEQAAPHGEILIGEPTYRLVAHAAIVDEVEPVAAKGRPKLSPPTSFGRSGSCEPSSAVRPRGWSDGGTSWSASWKASSWPCANVDVERRLSLVNQAWERRDWWQSWPSRWRPEPGS